MSKPTEQQINEAKQVLEDAGYVLGPLWHIDDVTDKLSEEQYRELEKDADVEGFAREALEDALYNDWVMEQIHNSIDDYIYEHFNNN